MKDKNYDNYFDEKTAEETPQEKLMTMVDTVEKQPIKEYKAGEKATGTVLSVGREYVFVDVGMKNEAMIKKMEFCDNDGSVRIKTGDTVEAFIVSTKNNEVVMSKSLASRKAGTKELVEAMKSGIPVEGKVTGINKGGFNVTVMGKKAFCPFSHMDLKFVDDPNTYLLKKCPFIISRVENRGKNIVLSRLPLLEKNIGEQFDELEKGIVKKTVHTGTINKVADFGLFVDLGGVEGLVHISEISWDRADNLKQSFDVGQSVECVILSIERNEPLRNSKVSLSIRMVGENPWEDITDKLSVGSSVEGTITRLTTFGAFVKLLPGIEGLIHVSEMSWGRKVRHPSDIVSEGDTVKVTLLAIDKDKRSVSCSLKDIADNPWNDVDQKYPVGSNVSGKVVSKTKYGYFIDLDENITGLLVHNNIGDDKKGSIKKGDTIEVTIGEINVEAQRISLSYGMVDTVADTSYKQESKKSTGGGNSTSEFGAMLLAAMGKKK